MITQKIKEIKSGKLTAEKNISNFISKIRAENPNINAVLHLNEHAISQAREIDRKIKKKEKVGKLAGLGVIIKSN
ncbi:MAG: amidase family protein, partial [Nanoarchaeota archaeon]